MKAQVEIESGTLAAFTVCADPELGSLMAQAPASVAGLSFAGEFQEYVTAGRRPHFPEEMKQARHAVALIDFDRDAAAAIETTEMLQGLSSPRVICVGVSSQLDSDLLLRAMRAGCSEFLQKPVQEAQLLETIERIQGRLAASAESSSGRGRVLMFFGAKGGVGASALAVHLAHTLVKRHASKTLLIDLHHQLGHVCLYLGLKQNQYHFDELVRNVDRLDAALLKGFTVRHPSGMDVIGAPDGCAVRHHTSFRDMERVFEFLRHEYDFVVIDASLQDDDSAAGIRIADETYLVSTPEIAALRDLSRHVQNLNLPETPATRLRIILNRASSQDVIGSSQVEKAVGLPVSYTIPEHRAELLQAVNAGEPVSPQRRSEFTAQLGKWSAQLAAQSSRAATAPAAKKKTGFWK